MPKTDFALKALLAGIALLLAANLAALLGGRAAAQAELPIAHAGLPAVASAGQIITLDGRQQVVTTSPDGQTLYIWRMGRFVNNEFDRVFVRSYSYQEWAGR